MTKSPPAPENIRLVHDTGEVVPLECVHVGVDPQGINLWAVTLLLGSRHHSALIEGKAHMAFDRLPGRTEVRVRFRGE